MRRLVEGVGVEKKRRWSAFGGLLFLDSGFRSQPKAAAPLHGNDKVGRGW